MDKRKVLLRQILKYTVFAVIVFLLYILQSTPGFLSVFGLKPVFIIPFCVALCILDDQWPVGIILIAGGLLTDLSANRVVGFFTIQLVIYCSICIVAVKFFLKATKRNAFYVSFAVMFIMLTADYLFTYRMHGYTHGLGLYLRNVVLVNAYSSAFSPLFYMLIDGITYSRFMRIQAR